MTARELEELVRESRARQGLPPRIEDRGALARVASLLAAQMVVSGADLEEVS